MANAKIIMARHNKLVDLKDAEIAKLTERADKLAGAQERLEIVLLCTRSLVLLKGDIKARCSTY